MVLAPKFFHATNLYEIIVQRVLYFIVITSTQAAVFGNIISESNTGVLNSLTYGFKNFGKYFWTNIIAGLIISTGFFLFIIPGFIWLIAFGFATAVIASEGIWGLQALLRSREYVRGRWYQVAGLVFGYGLLVGIPLIVISIIPHFLHQASTISFIIQSVITFLIFPLSTAYTFNLYKYLKTTRPNIEVKGKTGLIVAAIAGLILIIGLSAFAIFAKTYLTLRRAQINNQSNIVYSLSPSDYANINGGQQLADYIVSNLNRGVTKEATREALIKAGWSQQDIDQLLNAVKTTSTVK
jgi:hypothetical protein